MKPGLVRYLAAAVVAVLVAAVGTLLLLGSSAGAASSTPPWEPDPSATGTLTFYDSSGNVITSGSIDDHPMFAYAVGSAAVRSGDVQAGMFMAQPNPNAAAGLWNADQLSAYTTYPLTTGPATVKTLSQSHPVVSGASGDISVDDFIGEFPNTDPSGAGCAYSASPSGCTNTAYENMYEMRMRTAAPSGQQTTQYDNADIIVSGTTWTQVYPTPTAPSTTATSTTLTASPSPASTGQTVTLTATETPATAGSVQFKNGSAAIGSAVAVNGSGVATTTTTFASAGTESLSAVFTPTDTTDFTGSTGTASLTVSAVAKTNTTTTVTASPSPATAGQTVTLAATVTPAEPGTVQFEDGSTAIGTPVTVASGAASTTTSTLSTATHTIHAVFTPTDTSTINGSTGTTSEEIDPVPATTTSTALALNPAGPVDFGTSVALNATVTPSTAVGSVQFLDGSTALGSPVAVSSGAATLNTAALAGGTHSLTAKFVPTSAANFGTSTSSAQSLTVNQVASSTSLVLDKSTVAFGGSVTATATVTPAAAAGSVQFLDGSTPIGSSVTVTNGTASTTSSTLAGGSHSITAVFTPTVAADYSTSTSSAQSVSVTAVSTSTALTANPNTGVLTTTSVDLTATLTPASAAGSVQFMDGSTALGNPVTVAAGQAVTHATFPAPAATHSITAVFTPANSSDFTTSTSSPVSLDVTLPPPGTTTTAVTTTPKSPIAVGGTVTLNATITDTSATPVVGTVQFAVDGTDVGSAVTVSGGKASVPDTGLTVGSHTVTADFTADPSANLQNSTGTTTIAVVNPTTITLTASSTAPAVGAQDTLTATVDPAAAAGSVIFSDGGKALSTPITVSNGVASLVTTFSTAGAHDLQAVFVPSDPATYAASISLVVSTEAAALPTTTSDNASATGPGGTALPTDPTVAPGSSVTITITGLTPGETVDVVLHSTPVVLGTAKANAAGVATFTFTVPAGLTGSHTVLFVNSAGDPVGSFAFTAAAAAVSTTTPPATTSPGSSTGPLADTANDSQLQLSLGFGLLALGALFLAGTRRRVRVGRHHG